MHFYDDNQMEAEPVSPVSMPHVETLPFFNLSSRAYSWEAIVAL